MNKVTEDSMLARITKVDYTFLPDGKTTVCTLYVENGYTIQGMSACVDPANFNKAEGQYYAHQDALNKMWPLEGYLLAEKLWKQDGYQKISKNKIPGTAENWDNRILGADPAFVRRASPEMEEALVKALK